MNQSEELWGEVVLFQRLSERTISEVIARVLRKNAYIAEND